MNLLARSVGAELKAAGLARAAVVNSWCGLCPGALIHTYGFCRLSNCVIEAADL